MLRTVRLRKSTGSRATRFRWERASPVAVGTNKGVPGEGDLGASCQDSKAGLLRRPRLDRVLRLHPPHQASSGTSRLPARQEATAYQGVVQLTATATGLKFATCKAPPAGVGGQVVVQLSLHRAELYEHPPVAARGCGGVDQRPGDGLLVSGRTSSRILRSTVRGSRCSRAARKARSVGVDWTFWPCICRWRTMTWWRRARISASLAWSLMGSSRSIASALVTPR